MVVIAIRVFPLPRCAALIYSEITEKILKPMTILKYMTESAMVSEFAPQSRMNGSANTRQRSVNRMYAAMMTESPDRKVTFASRCRFSPTRLAIRREIPELIA